LTLRARRNTLARGVNPDIANTRPFQRRGLSLEHKVPLVVSGLLTALLSLFVWLAYRDIATSSLIAAGERNTRLVADLGRLLGQNSQQRRTLVYRRANDAGVTAAISGGPIEPAEAALSALRTSIDSSLIAVLLDSARRPVRYIGTQPGPELIRRLAAVLTGADTTASHAANGEFFIERDRARFWTVAAVRPAGRTVGYMALLRAVGASAETVRTFHNLIGQSGTVLLGNTSDPDGLAVNLEGTILPGSREAVRDSQVERYMRAGARQVASRQNIPGTPWDVIVESSVTAVNGRANHFLRRSALIGLVMLFFGTPLIWLISRRFTQPIRAMSDVAGAIADRRYDRRVRVERTDELGVLGASFNHMANEVQRALGEAETSKAEAERANRAKSEFLGNMSHEIRTPINAILGYTDLMALGVDGPLTESQRSRLERVRTSGQYLVSLIDDLLDFSRLETTPFVLEPRTARAADAVHTAMAVIDRLATAKTVQLSAQVEPDAHYVGDPRRVEQILVNLLGNAVKFTPSGGRVRLECRTISTNGRPGATEFVVEDTGIGIAPDRLETIFEPFVQLHSGYTRPHGGSGLGLTLSSRLASLMGGKISVQSQVGVGSRFTLSLPAPAHP
jgi:signal transduction histidine kinase